MTGGVTRYADRVPIPTDPMTDFTDAQQRILDDARLLLTSTCPWIAPAVLKLRAYPMPAGVGALCGADRYGNLYLSLDSDQGEDATAASAAMQVVAAVWRVLYGVDERYPAGGVDREAWNTAVDSVVNRAGATTALFTPDGVRYLPRPTSMVTVRGLVTARPELAHAVAALGGPDVVGLESLYALLRRSGDEDPGATGSGGEGEDDTDSDAQRDTENKGVFSGNIPEQSIPSSAPRTSAPELDQLRGEIADALAEDADVTSSPESAPDGSAEWGDLHGTHHLALDRMLHRALGAMVTGAAGNRRSWARPTTYSAPGLLIPGRAADRRRVMIGIDVSESISREQMLRGVLEVQHAADGHRFEVSYTCVDRTADEPVRLDRGEPVMIRDGVGTDMRAAFAAFDRHRAEAAVLFTDGRTTWPATAPATRHLVVVLVCPAAMASADRRKLLESTRAEIPWAQVVLLP